MISIIICSVHPKVDSALAANIQATIGSDYEVVLIDNSDGRHGICSAYNEGVSKAKGDILCFMHEDVMYHSADWGKVVEDHFKNSQNGLLGVAGSVAVSDYYDWRFFGFSKTHVVQGYRALTFPTHYYIKGVEWDTRKPKERMAIIDGCWFCLRKQLFDEGKLRFDEETFQGFHLYDSDISMQVNKSGYLIHICSNIIIEHFSEGVYTETFKESLALFIKKWQKDLPCCVEKIDAVSWQEGEREAAGKLEERIKQDAVITQIIGIYAQNKNAKQAPSLSKEAETLIESSVYQFAKDSIKYAASYKEAWKALALYKNLQCHPRLRKLIRKFLYYRFLHTNSHRHIKHIQSLRPQ